MAINFQVHRDFEMQVLGNFENLPFHLVETAGDTSFPSLAEVSELREPELFHRFSLPNDVTKKLTVVIPPESLEPGAYDIRIVVAPDTEPRDDVKLIRDPLLSFSLTLYYGSGTFPALPETRTAERKPFSRREHVLLETGFFSNTLLLPSADFLDNVDEGDEHLGGEVDVGDSAEVVALYFADAMHDEEQEVYTNFLIGADFVTNAWRLTEVEPRPHLGEAGPDATAPVAYHSLVVDERKDVRFAVFSRPFRDQSSVDEWRRLTELSNVVFLSNPEP